MKKIFFILFFACNSNSVYSQFGWVQQSPLPTGNYLNSIKFVNNKTGFICGYRTILKTTNNGVQWNIIDSNSNYYFISLNSFDSNTVLVLGSPDPFTTNFKILKTTNGGVNWTQIDLPTTKNLFKLNCTTNNTAYIVGDSGVILKSINRGVNWTLLPQINTVRYLSSVFFVNEYTGYTTASLIGGTSVYKTINGGNTWIQQTVSQTTGNLMAVFFLNENTGYVAGGLMWSEIQKTTDGGNNWFLQNTQGSALNSINFINVNTGFSVGNGGTILNTTNGGDIWTFQYSYLFPDEGLFGIYFINPETVFLVGGPGMISITTNGGNNWNSQFSGSVYDLYSICFSNLNTGYAIGTGGPINRALIKTTNGGINWLYQTTPWLYQTSSLGAVKQKKIDMETLGEPLNIYFLDSNIGFILAGYLIFRTTDGGNNWLKDSLQYNFSCYDISFINNLTGYITGDKTYKTTNGGINWFILNDTSGYINRFSIKFKNDIGYIAGEFGLILKTTNGGINWISQNSGTVGDLYSIFLNDENTGYICGDSKILKTTNGGNNWLPVYSGNSIFNSIYFVNINTGYCTGEFFNGIFKTTNSGNNWFTTEQNYGLSSIFFLNDSIGYACGPSGIIIKTTNGGNPIGINKISNEIVKNFILYQNYPNPFNPSTKIKFDIPSLPTTKGAGVIDQVTLKIYDILGREVATLINEKLKPGSYEVTWDGSKYASGVYFYQLKSKEFIQTKKMVVLR